MIEGVIMLVKNTEATRNVRNAIASMAIEEMYFNKEFVLKLIEVAEGKKTYEGLRKEMINK